MIKITDEMKALMEKQHYGLVGEHSACKICDWTKKSMRDEGVCYKEKFYGDLHGLKSHRCMQITPALYFCNNRCLYCWRATDKTAANDMTEIEVDDPKEIALGCIKAYRKKLSGFKGYSGINNDKFDEAQEPASVAISLTGEPTLYPRLSELIRIFKDMGKAVFLVTNGQNPEGLVGMEEPSQFYLSLDAPTREIYKKIDVPQLPDFWERLNKTIEIMSAFKCKKAVRLTMVKGWNDCCFDEYAQLIKKADADFVEVKAYMWVGFSKYRLGQEEMPRFAEVQEMARELNKHLGYVYKDEDERSRVVLLAKE